jgi:hypothetical protein
MGLAELRVEWEGNGRARRVGDPIPLIRLVGCTPPAYRTTPRQMTDLLFPVPLAPVTLASGADRSPRSRLTIHPPK